MPQRKRMMRKGRKRPSTYAKKTRARNVSTAVKTYVNRAIHKNIENKSVSFRGDTFFAAYFANLDLNVKPVFPCTAALTIGQGIGAGDRIGNIIKTRRLVIKYTLYPRPYEPTLNPAPVPKEVIVWFGFLKRDRTAQPTVANYGELFQNGSFTQAPTSTLWDAMLPINNDLFTVVKTCRHKLGSAIYSDYAGIKPYNYYANNDFKLNCSKTINLTKHINKTLRFNDGASDPDTGLWMWMTAVNADGSSDLTNIASVGMFYNLTYDYEDA